MAKLKKKGRKREREIEIQKFVNCQSKSNF